MITIYGIQNPNVSRVRAALLQKGLKFQHVSVNAGNKSEEFKKLTPVDQIPVMEDDDGTLVWDSLHVFDYLDSTYPKTYRMIPKDADERAKVLNVIASVIRISQSLSPLYVEKFNLEENLRQKNESHRALTYLPRQKDDLKKDISYRLERMKEELENKKFFAGKFSAADAAVLACLVNLESLGFEIGTWKAWKQNLMKDKKIALMFPPQDEKGVSEL